MKQKMNTVETLDDVWTKYLGDLTPAQAVAEYGGVRNLIVNTCQWVDESYYWPEMRATYRASELLMIYLERAGVDVDRAALAAADEAEAAAREAALKQFDDFGEDELF